MRPFALLVALCAAQDAAALPAARKPASGSYDVRSFGAVPNGKTKATDAVRRAIAAASAAGGGTILFSGGVYLTGPIRLASNITLEVEAGAVLRFSSDFDDALALSGVLVAVSLAILLTAKLVGGWDAADRR